MMILVKTLLQIPLFYLIVSGCNSEGENKDLVMGLSIALIVLLLPFLFYITFLLSDLNPFSSLIFAGESHISRITNSLIKLSLVLYATLDKSRKSELHLLIIILIAKVIIIITNHCLESQQNFNKLIKKYQQWQDHIISWFILFLIISYYTSHRVELFLYFFLLLMSALILVNYLQEISEDRLLTENFMQLEETRKIERHILRLI